MSNQDQVTPGKRGSGLTPALIEELKTQGLNQAQIARKFGISRQAVSEMKRKYGRFSQTPRERALEQFPWRVPAVQQECSPDKRMRDHAEYVVTGGQGMEGFKLRRLRAFYENLSMGNLVVEHDPTLPPVDGIKCGGWRYVPREESDGQLIIRVNRYTTITDDGEVLWRMPDTWPQLEKVVPTQSSACHDVAL